MSTTIASYNGDFVEHIEVLGRTHSSEAVQTAIETGITICLDALKQGRKLLFCGNGGSAADCQHLATELTIRYIKDRPAIAAIALTTDTSALTAAGNDLGFDKLFSRQVEAIGQPGDVLLGFSTSGRSKNVVAAAEAARARDMKVVFFGGGDGGTLASMADASIVVPSKTTARIQEMHILIGHIFCGQIEQRLGYVTA